MIRIDRYTKWIQETTSFSELDGVIHNILSANLFEHVAPELEAKIQSLEISGDLDGFCKIMSWAVAYSHYNGTALTLLKNFANRVARAVGETLTQEDLTPILLVTTYICADNKDFIKGFSEEQRKDLTRNLIRYTTGFEEGMELDHDEILQMLDDVNSGKNLEQHLTSMCDYLWRNMIDQDIQTAAHELAVGSPNITMSEALIRGELLSLISMFGDTSDQLKATGIKDENSVVYYPLGKLMNTICTKLRYYVQEAHECNEKGFGEMMQASLQIITKYYPTTFLRRPIEHVVNQYLSEDKFVQGWTEGDFLKAWKLYLDQDTCFEMFRQVYYNGDPYGGDHFEISVRNREEDVAKFVARLNHYLGYKDPKQVLAPATEASKKTEQWKYEEDEPEQEAPQDQESEESSEDRDYDIEATQSKKGYHKSSKIQQDTQNKIYRAYKNYKDNEQKVDSQLNKMFQSAKRAFTGDKTEEILSGQKWTPLKLLKKVLRTAAIFSFSKVAGFIYLLVGHTLDKRRTDRQRREIILELDTEIKLLEEKIEDARGDGNRQAKYALMRTKAELERARDRIRYNLNASREDMQSAKDIITGRRSSRARTQLRNDREEY